MGEPLHDQGHVLTAHFSRPLPFLQSQKVVTLPLLVDSLHLPLFPL